MGAFPAYCVEIGEMVACQSADSYQRRYGNALRSKYMK
jgi:hypothetical protein